MAATALREEVHEATIAPAPEPARAAAVEGLRGAWQAYCLVFTASACSLVIEILAGRILAPYLGVSLHT